MKKVKRTLEIVCITAYYLVLFYAILIANYAPFEAMVIIVILGIIALFHHLHEIKHAKNER